MLVNLLLKHSLLLHVSRDKYWAFCCSYSYPKWFSRIFIKRLQLIARPLLMKTKLPTFAWRHAIMHAAALVRIRPTTYHEYSSSQLVLRKQPNNSHLWIFGCAVYVPIAPTQRTKMGPQWRLGIYVGFLFSIYHKISWTFDRRFFFSPLCGLSF